MQPAKAVGAERGGDGSAIAGLEIGGEVLDQRIEAPAEQAGHRLGVEQVGGAHEQQLVGALPQGVDVTGEAQRRHVAASMQHPSAARRRLGAAGSLAGPGSQRGDGLGAGAGERDGGLDGAA